MTCRCPICGKKNAGRAGARSFAGFAAGAGWRDEHGRSPEAYTRKQERKLRRVREGRAWKREEW